MSRVALKPSFVAAFAELVTFIAWKATLISKKLVSARAHYLGAIIKNRPRKPISGFSEFYRGLVDVLCIMDITADSPAKKLSAGNGDIPHWEFSTAECSASALNYRIPNPTSYSFSKYKKHRITEHISFRVGFGPNGRKFDPPSLDSYIPFSATKLPN